MTLPPPDELGRMTGYEVVAVLRQAVEAERAACQEIALQAAERWRGGVWGNVADILDGVAAAIGARGTT